MGVQAWLARVGPRVRPVANAARGHVWRTGPGRRASRLTSWGGRPVRVHCTYVLEPILADTGSMIEPSTAGSGDGA
jgi:hypothetical protein